MSAKLNLFLYPETETMKQTLPLLTTGALALAAATTATAQYAPPPPTQPFPGFLNQELRAKDPYWANWDFGAQLRLRCEIKDNGGFTATGAAADFRKSVSTGAAGTDNDNSYFLSKLLVRAGYTDKWWSAFIQGRQSTTTGDDRNPNAESDGPMDLHQAYLTVGNHKEFPVSIKVGRQELSYGEERLVGAFAWNNVGRVFDAAKVRWQHEHFTAEAFASRVIIPDDNNANVANDYDWFSGLHVTTKAVPKQTTDLYFYSRNASVGSATALGVGLPAALNGPAARDIYTFGLRGKSNPRRARQLGLPLRSYGPVRPFQRPAARRLRPGQPGARGLRDGATGWLHVCGRAVDTSARGRIHLRFRGQGPDRQQARDV